MWNAQVLRHDVVLVWWWCAHSCLVDERAFYFEQRFLEDDFLCPVFCDPFRVFGEQVRHVVV
jgi:hypothetical protein